MKQTAKVSSYYVSVPDALEAWVPFTELEAFGVKPELIRLAIRDGFARSNCSKFDKPTHLRLTNKGMEIIRAARF